MAILYYFKLSKTVENFKKGMTSGSGWRPFQKLGFLISYIQEHGIAKLTKSLKQ